MAQIAGGLEKRRQGWYAALDVPPSQRAAAGKKRLRKSLRTRDKHVASARLPAALVKLHADLRTLLRKHPETDPLTQEAMAWRGTVKAAEAGRETGLPNQIFEDRDGELHQVPDISFAMDLIEARAEVVQRREGAGRATMFADLATGRTTPTMLHVDEWLAGEGARGARRSRTSSDYRSVVAAFASWTADAGSEGGDAVSGATIEKTTRRVAARYAAQLAGRVGPVRTRTLIGALKGYWAWLETNGLMPKDAVNPWVGQAPAKRKGSAQGDPERAFTEEEIRALLSGPANTFMHDLMTFAALTGARIEEVSRLTVAMCGPAVMRMPGVKGSNPITPRDVPVHPDLTPIIARRLAGQKSGHFLFPEFGDANRHGERSGAVSKAFGRYRVKAGVHDREAGQRRSLVNFHSFRRWFSTRAFEAGQDRRVIEAVIGHKPPTNDVLMTSYIDPKTLPDRMRECVQAVKLPVRGGAPAPVAGPRAVKGSQ